MTDRTPIQVASTVTITLTHSGDCWSRSGRPCTCGLEERLRWEMSGRQQERREVLAR